MSRAPKVSTVWYGLAPFTCSFAHFAKCHEQFVPHLPLLNYPLHICLCCLNLFRVSRILKPASYAPCSAPFFFFQSFHTSPLSVFVPAFPRDSQPQVRFVLREPDGASHSKSALTGASPEMPGWTQSFFPTLPRFFPFGVLFCRRYESTSVPPFGPLVFRFRPSIHLSGISAFFHGSVHFGCPIFACPLEKITPAFPSVSCVRHLKYLCLERFFVFFFFFVLLTAGLSPFFFF